MENRIPKNRYNGSAAPDADKSADKQDTLKKIEAEMDKHAADIAITVSDIFKYMAMSTAMLPNMELDVDILRLKIDDDGVLFEINYPDGRKRKERDVCEDCDGCTEESDDYDDDEEGLLYDGD